MAANIHLRPGHYVDDPNVGAGDAAWARVIAAPPQQIDADSARIQQQVDDQNLPQAWPGGRGNNPIDPQGWNQRFAGPRVDPRTHQAQLGDIRGLFDRLTRHIQTQRTNRQQTNNYVLELQRLIAKLRDCITRLLEILVRTRNNMDALNALRDDMNNAPDLEAIREQLEASVAYMINDELDPDAFRAQLVALVDEINRICLEVENMRPYAQPPDDGGGQGWQAQRGYPAEDDGARGARGARGLGRGGPSRRGSARGGPSPRGSARRGSTRRGSSRSGSSRREEKTETRSEETKDGDGWQPPQVIQDEIDALDSLADSIGDGGNTISDGGRSRADRAARRERELREGSGNQQLGFGSSTGRGGWQTPEKLESLSKSKPIRTLDSIKRKKSKRGNKSKRRRKKTKGRRNKKKKQTKRKKNKKRKKKRTRKR